MSFSVPENIRPLREKALRFVEQEIYPHERVLNEMTTPAAKAKQAELIKRSKAEGLWALGHPKHMGGVGLPWIDYAYINEVIGRSDAAMDIFGSYTLQTCLMIDAAATPEQRDELLYRCVTGETYVAFSVTEPNVASSDPTNIQTTAVEENGEWVINGRKWFVSGAEHADWICVMCRTEPEGTPVHEAFSMILVPINTPGVKMERSVYIMGTASNHPEMSYTNVRVPVKNLLGKRGQGFKLFQTRLGPARITNCMRWLGQAQRAFDLMCNRINTRELAGGKRLADKQLMQQNVYDSYIEIQTSRMMVIDAAERLDRGEEGRIEISAIKTYTSRMLQTVIDRALQVHGALGVCDDTPLEYMYRHARIMRIVDGPDEVHIERVGKIILREYAKGEEWDFGLR